MSSHNDGYHNVIYANKGRGAFEINNIISQKIKRKMTDSDIKLLKSFLKENEEKNWSLLNNEQLKERLAGNFLIKYFTPQGRNEQEISGQVVDIHEIQKLHIGTAQQEPDQAKLIDVNEDGFPRSYAVQVSNEGPEQGGSLGSLDQVGNINSVRSIDQISDVTKILGLPDAKALQTLLAPNASNLRTYFQADTRYRSNDPDGTLRFSWSILYNSQTNGVGIINVVNSVKNIVAIRVYPFRIPYVDQLDKATQYNRITLLIDELAGSAIVGQENRKYHFIFKYEKVGNMAELTPLPDPRSASFQLAKPITNLDSLTLSFGYPLHSLSFPKDRGFAIVYYENPARFVSLVPNNLQTGDLIYISGFTTLAPGTDNAIIATVNDDNGYTALTDVDGVTFYINEIDLTVINPINRIPTQQVNVYYGSKRMFIPFEIEYRP